MSSERLLAELRRHVSDERVLAAIAAVPRERYVAPEHRADAWENVALPIACGQTISQPLVVARMCELLRLRGDEAVLDVGTGSGYHAAVLARLARHVYSIEVVPELSDAAGRAGRPWCAGAGLGGGPRGRRWRACVSPPSSPRRRRASRRARAAGWAAA